MINDTQEIHEAILLDSFVQFKPILEHK